MTSKELAKIAVKALDDKKGEDITVIDISEVSVLADYFIIAGGSNRSQIQAMSDNVDEQLSKNGGTLKQIEGYEAGNCWSEDCDHRRSCKLDQQIRQALSGLDADT